MTKPKKPSTDELYAQSQWSDNLSFSRKAMDESKKKTDKLASPHQASPASPAAREAASESEERLEQYVNEMNQEIHRMSDAVGERMDDIGSKLNRSFGKIVKPLGKSVHYVADSASESVKNMGSGIGKAVLQEFTSVIRTLGDKMAPPGSKAAAAPEPTSPEPIPRAGATGPLGTAPLPPPLPVSKLPEAPTDVPRFEYHFGKLLQQKIFFSTIHNQPFLNERDIEAFRPEDPVQIFEWMERGVEEIRNCAPYGQKLPTPQKGPYMNIPMQDILLQVNTDDLSQFLRFVCNRPQPFQQKALKLSEAFATWAHKGAPAQ
ncbi:MAG: hypothetical protein IGS03_04325 [Candidatus Sericytochromatia bacterium]|nr:hypothetical protein [Candidatus Sericytochromatia bacterium]